MTVKEEPLINGQPVAKQPRLHLELPRGDWSLVLGRIALWLALAAFGGVWWMINGGFSVIGLGPAAAAFGDIGRLGHALITVWSFRITLPSAAIAAGLPTVQPVLPWAGVVAASLLQVVAVYRKRRRLAIPLWMVLVTLLLSLYDLGTTWYGLGTTRWVQQAGSAFQIVLALILTFGLELLVGVLLRAKAKE